MSKRSLVLRSTVKRAEGRTFRFIGSTSCVDRCGEVVEQNWDLDNFRLNPVVLYAHDQSGLPIGKSIKTEVVEGRLVFDVEFVPREIYPFAGVVEDLADAGFLNTCSVGFLPIDVDANVIKKSELLELSIVPVPANYEALLQRGTKRILPVFKAWDSKSLVETVIDRKALELFVGKAEEPTAAEDPPTDAEPVDASLESLSAAVSSAIECLNKDDAAGLARDLEQAQAIVLELIAAEASAEDEDSTADETTDDEEPEQMSLSAAVVAQLKGAEPPIEQTLADSDAVSRILAGLKSKPTGADK